MVGKGRSYLPVRLAGKSGMRTEEKRLPKPVGWRELESGSALRRSLPGEIHALSLRAAWSQPESGDDDDDDGGSLCFAMATFWEIYAFRL